MNIVIGKIVNTFGIKGELKIVSNFEMANRAFKKGNKIIINNKERLITDSRFHHHNYLVEIDNIKDINEVTYLIGAKVSINKDKITKTVSDLTGISAPLNVEGKWGYQGPAVEFKSDNLLNCKARLYVY